MYYQSKVQQFCTVRIAASGQFGEYTKIENMCIKLPARMVSLFPQVRLDGDTRLHGYFDVTVKSASLIFIVKVNVKYISRLVLHYTHFPTKAN